MALYCVGIDPRSGEVRVEGPCRSDASAFEEGKYLQDPKVYRHKSTNKLVAAPLLKRIYLNGDQRPEESTNLPHPSDSRFQSLRKKLFGRYENNAEQEDSEENWE